MSLQRKAALARTTALKRTATTKRRPISPASPEQRAKVKDRACIVCRLEGVPCDPAHVCSRAQGGCGDALCVVPLCRVDHIAYDTGELDLLPYLEPHYRPELAHALEHLGLVGLYRRVTNERLAA